MQNKKSEIDTVASEVVYREDICGESSKEKNIPQKSVRTLASVSSFLGHIFCRSPVDTMGDFFLGDGLGGKTEGGKWTPGLLSQTDGRMGRDTKTFSFQGQSGEAKRAC